MRIYTPCKYIEISTGRCECRNGSHNRSSDIIYFPVYSTNHDATVLDVLLLFQLDGGGVHGVVAHGESTSMEAQ